MKTTAHILLISGLVAGGGSLLAQDAPGDGPETHGDPFIPVGLLQVTPTVVQPYVQPNMNWDIEYPKSIPDLLTITPSSALIMEDAQDEIIEIRCVGIGESPCTPDMAMVLWVRVGGSGASWNRIFYGDSDDILPGKVLFKQKANDGDRVDFAVRGYNPNSGWGALYWTVEDAPNISALIDGEFAPTDSSAFYGGIPEEFMAHYISDANEVTLGPRDILLMFESEPVAPGEGCFDLQDIVVVTTIAGKNNNGHGNNLDGYDMSNTGNSDGVYGTGDVNTDADGNFIDDEGFKIKRKTSS
jgi:hypothetical protein